jgi:hypothetical protein
MSHQDRPVPLVINHQTLKQVLGNYSRDFQFSTRRSHQVNENLLFSLSR